MPTTGTDLRFFTNAPDETLYDRFVATLKDVQYFDLLVGYFRTSGFQRLARELGETEKIRILVGLSIDQQAYVSLQQVQGLDFESGMRTKEVFVRNLQEEMDNSEDTAEVSDSAESMVEFLKSGRLEMRAYPGRNLHAKVYISRFKPEDRDFGRVITGSSNFSENGLVGQLEFNVELKDRPDVAFALEKFEELWAEGVDISEEYVQTITTKTWLNDQITPFDLYLKLLYEYFKEDLQAADAVQDVDVPEGFMDLEYQRQAVINARKILDGYGGVFLADVVGLGKTIITARLLQGLPGRKLVLCPPVLMEDWQDALRDFYVPGTRVESVGKLEQLASDPSFERYQVVVIDEAHRFRNEETETYALLHRLCRGKQVVLVSATPLNNRVSDIGALLKLFQSGRNSDIPGVRNIDAFFRERQLRIERAKREAPESVPGLVAEISAEVREKVLKHVMVRRTRSEIRRYFAEDIEQQGLTFPEIAPPERVIYEFDPVAEAVFDRTIGRIARFTFARYTPLLYLRRGIGVLEAQSQRNMGGFMKSVLVKRLESSKHAFTRTIERSIASHELFLTMLDEGEVHLGKNVNVHDLMGDDEDASERLLALQRQGKVTTYASSEFNERLRADLEADLALLREIAADWATVTQDAKLEEFQRALQERPLLRDGKVVVFSESKETAEHLFEQLAPLKPGRVYLYTSEGGRLGEERHGKGTARSFIRENFDPGSKNPQDQVDLLIATDVLAEGINLHRANIIVNYDLPWNPTKVLQRVGRVNRIGTEHDHVHIFNIFPTSTSDKHLGLEENITAKIQAFHTVLGEDAKYLTDDEEVGTYELFGDRLYNTLNTTESYEGGEEEDSELGYYQIVREVMEEQPALFERVKRLPRKARTGRVVSGPGDRLVTFFRRGKLKKFVQNEGGVAREVTFLEAARLLACDPDEPRVRVPRAYFELLAGNDRFFGELSAEGAAPPKAPASNSNEARIIRTLRAPAIRNADLLTEEHDFVQQAVNALLQGRIPRATARSLWGDIRNSQLDPIAVLAALRRRLGDDLAEEAEATDVAKQPREVILSAYLVGEQ